MKSYANAFSFRRALEDRLAAAARSEGADLQRLRRQVAFDRLLVRLFSDGNPPWCLKGGYALELKLSMARSTKDLDLGLSAEVLTSDDLLETLQVAASRESGDFFVFAIGAPVMIELLCRGAMDLIDPDVVPVTPAGNHLVATLSVDGARQVSIGVKNFDQRPTASRIKELIEAEPSEPTAAAIPELITRSALSRLKPGALARRYARWKETSVENVEPLLLLASAMLLKAGDENVPERPCALVSFEFDGDSEATKVCIIGIEDHLGRHIDAWSILIDWKPDLERDVGWFLAEAVSRYLNRQAPEWNKAPGAGGYINLSISWNAAGELKAEVSGRVRIWTRAERRLGPPSR